MGRDLDHIVREVINGVKFVKKEMSDIKGIPITYGLANGLSVIPYSVIAMLSDNKVTLENLWLSAAAQIVTGVVYGVIDRGVTIWLARNVENKKEAHKAAIALNITSGVIRTLAYTLMGTPAKGVIISCGITSAIGSLSTCTLYDLTVEGEPSGKNLVLRVLENSRNLCEEILEETRYYVEWPIKYSLSQVRRRIITE